jgi:hypothetical protein
VESSGKDTSTARASEAATKNADLTTSKCLWNSTISTEDARYMCADAKNFYLNTILDCPEYMKLTLGVIPQETIDKYKLLEKKNNGYVYIQSDKGMYGLPQSGRLANDLLFKRLTSHIYHPVCHTHGLYKHEKCPVTFTLVVENFWVKYVGNEHASCLLNAFQQYYEFTDDWTGKLYCGITLDWDCKNRTVDLSMPGYIESALHKFQHKEPARLQHKPFPALLCALHHVVQTPRWMQETVKTLTYYLTDGATLDHIALHRMTCHVQGYQASW